MKNQILYTVIGMKDITNAYASFYANDYNWSGSTIKSLSSKGLIKKTGNTKEALVYIRDGIFRNTEVNEWIVDPAGVESYKNQLKNDLDGKKFKMLMLDLEMQELEQAINTLNNLL